MTKPTIPPHPGIFGQLTLQNLRADEDLTRKVMPLVKAACEHTKGRFTVDDTANGLLSGECQLWCVVSPQLPIKPLGTAVTRKRGKVFEILALGPDYSKVATFLPQLTRTAKMQGCERVHMAGPGFWRLKKLLPEGWRSVAEIYEQDLSAPDAVIR